MANNSFRNSVSPGIYSRFLETPISTTTSVSNSALGISGLFQRGSAFSITHVPSKERLTTLFGNLSTEKYKGNNFPKYEAGYICNEFLKESSELYVCRILGLSGFESSSSWGIVMSGATYDNEIIAILRSKGTLGSNQVVDFDIADNESLDATIANLTDSFAINIITEGSQSSLSIPLTGSTLSGTMSRNGSVVTSGYTGTVAGVTVDLENSFLGGVLDLTSVTGTTIPNQTNQTQIISGLYKSDGTLTIVGGVTFYMYNTTLQSSVKITTPSDVVISNVSVGDLGALVYTAASTFSLTNTTVSYFLKGASGSPLVEVSLERTDSNFILNVLGTSIDDIEGNPIYVDEFYLDGYDWTTLVSDPTIKLKLVELPKPDLSNYKSAYRAATTPWIVSQLSGGKVKNLFRAITISDGESANTDIKLSIENVDTINKTFDLLVRNFGDLDSNQVILESYRNLNLIKDDKNYIGKRIGDNEGEYSLNSDYIVIEVADGSLQNESPSGFEGFPIRKHVGYNYPQPKYNTQINEDIKVRRQTLGIVSTAGSSIDTDILKYKGISNNITGGTVGYDWGTIDSERTKGFHIQTEASSLTGFVVPSTSVFVDPDTGDLLADDDIKLRYKFTTVFYGGFDGWNIYAQNRGLSSDYRYNKTQGKAGLNNGAFRYFADENFPEGYKAITSDYYAFLLGARMFANPKTVDVNLLATAGISWNNQPALVDEILDMIENERCDALYLVNTDDTVDNSKGSMYSPKEISQLLDDAGFDTTFATTFYPWVQYADADNDSKYIWLPPTKDLARCIAYTDNVGYPWFAPVGFGRGTVNAEQARTKLKAADTEYLTAANLNYVESFKAEGLKLWGQRLLRKDADNFVVSRIGVQRLNLYLRANIRNVVKKDIFEQNDDILVATIKKQISPIVQGVADQRGIEKDYKIEVFQTPEDKDQRQVRVKISYKPIGALEFIEITYSVNPSSVTFA
jgi:hypothetical protein